VIYFGIMCGLLAGISGCEHNQDRDRGGYYEGYRWENGDRIAPDGHRDVHWCDYHPEDEHCQ
jgi:hypothetical protein